MPTWQLDDVRSDAEVLQAYREPIRRQLARLIFVLIEDDVHNAAGLLGQLRSVRGSELCAYSAGGVAKAGLPQYG